MPHNRNRHLEEVLLKLAKASPLVGVLGHRQVGKTTLLTKICKTTVTLDQKKVKEEATADPQSFLKKHAGHHVVLDECQTVPELFPALKEHVRIHKPHGQFFLSGSVRFTSRRAIRESLTGRILNTELLPMVVSEIEGRNLSDQCVKALEHETLEALYRADRLPNKEMQHRIQQMQKYFSHGGLPGVCFLRERTLRELKWDEQLRTMLDRDLRLVQKTTLALQDLQQFCRILSNLQASPLDFTEIAKESGISTPTVKKLLFALEAIYLIRTLPIEGGRKGHVLFFEDQGEGNWLRLHEQNDDEQLTHFCFTQIRAQFQYRISERVEPFQYRTRSNALVPIAFRNAKGVLGVIAVADETQGRTKLLSAESFLKTYPKSKVLILHLGTQWRLLQPRVLVAPAVAFV